MKIQHFFKYRGALISRLFVFVNKFISASLEKIESKARDVSGSEKKNRRKSTSDVCQHTQTSSV